MGSPRDDDDRAVVPDSGRALQALKAITNEYRDRLASSRPEAAGVGSFFQDARRRMAAVWAPSTLHLPSRTKAMVESMQSMNRAALSLMEGRSLPSQLALEDGRITPDEWRAAMREAALEARRVTSAEVAVTFSATGAVLDVRISRSSGFRTFDRQVLDAARETLAHETPPPMPGDALGDLPAGRVARFRFEVMMSAVPPVPPVVGVTFDESQGTFRAYYPGQVNWKLRVVFLGARRGADSASGGENVLPDPSAP